MKMKISRALALAASLTITSFIPALSETIVLPTDAEMKAGCMDTYGPKCTWFWGCSGGEGNTPEEIARKASNQASGTLSTIIVANIAPWYASWWGWTPPENEQEFDLLTTQYQMFDTCDIDGKLIFFPGPEDIAETSDLTEDRLEVINEKLSVLPQH